MTINSGVHHELQRSKGREQSSFPSRNSIVLGLLFAPCSVAQDIARDSRSTDAQQSDSDLSAIRAESKAFVAAFNKGDAKAIAALWTEDGEYIDDVGRRFIGRDEIQKGYASFFDDNPKATLRIMIDSVRLLGDSTAIEDGRAVVDPPPEGVPGYQQVHGRSRQSRWQSG